MGQQPPPQQQQPPPQFQQSQTTQAAINQAMAQHNMRMQPPPPPAQHPSPLQSTMGNLVQPPAISRVRGKQAGGSPGAATSPSPIASGSAAPTPATVAASPKLQPKSPKGRAKKPAAPRQRRNSTAKTSPPAAESPVKTEVLQLRPPVSGKRGREDELSAGDAGPSMPSPKRPKTELLNIGLGGPMPPAPHAGYSSESVEDIKVKKEEETAAARGSIDVAMQFLGSSATELQKTVTAPLTAAADGSTDTDAQVDVSALLDLLQSVVTDAGGVVDASAAGFDLLGGTGMSSMPMDSGFGGSDLSQQIDLEDFLFDFTRYDEDEAASKANTPELLHANTTATVEESPASVLDPTDHAESHLHPHNGVSGSGKEHVVVQQPGAASEISGYDRYLGYEAIELVAGPEAAYFAPGLTKFEGLDVGPGDASTGWAITPA